MRIISSIAIAGILTIVFMVLVTCVAASPEIEAYLGDTVTLSGYSYGSPTVYLYLTGPNLAANGVALDDITRRADQGGFTRVDVDDHDHWVYEWDTHAVGGRLDPGTYTVWVVNGPVDRSRLSNADYRTISTVLARPGITVETPAQPGALLLRSTPDGASLVLNGEYRGSSPQTIGDLEPGIYNVTFSRFGYSKLSIPVRVEAGKTTEVNATLIRETGSLAVNTSPAGARLMIDGVYAGIAPVTLTNLTVGNHTLTVAQEGYTTTEQPVRVIASYTMAADVVLAPAAPSTTATPRAAGFLPAAMLACFVCVLLVAFHRSRCR